MRVSNWISLFVLTAIALSLPPSDPKGIGKNAIAASPREIAQIAKQITVRIMGESSSGSGVLVAREGETYWALTCRHIVDSASDIYQIRTQDGQRYTPVSSKIQRFNQVNLAVIPFVSSSSYLTATIGDSRPLAEGDSVYISGFPIPANRRNPDLDEFQFTNGIISSILNPPRPDGYGFTHTSLTYTGMGGAPVFNRDGQLVGIHCGGDRDPENLALKTGFNWGIPINTFTQLAQPMDLTLRFSTPVSPPPTNSVVPTLPNVPTEKPVPQPNEQTW